MNNKEKIKAIKKWQKCKFVHQLTCGKEKCSGVLEPKERKYKDIASQLLPNNEIYAIYLKCPKCDYFQDTIPEIVFNLNYEPFERLEEIISEKKKNE